jgi:hypothetical protein
VVAFVGSNRGLGALVRSGVGTVAGVTVFLVAARVLGVTEIRELLTVRGGAASTSKEEQARRD